MLWFKITQEQIKNKMKYNNNTNFCQRLEKSGLTYSSLSIKYNSNNILAH